MFHEIIDFWFHEIDKSQRFKKDEAFDQLIISRFSDIHQQAAQCELFEWRKEPLGALAEIIILDQFSRNMFRNDARSFAFDPIALTLAQTAIVNASDTKLNPEQRSFLYMPFMHSESLVIHEQAMQLFDQPGLEGNLDYEIKHKAIIEKFGRYPHRNEVLGRDSTKEELEFLSNPGSSF